MFIFIEVKITFFRKPIPCFSDPSNLSEGQVLRRQVRISRRKKYRKCVSIALPKTTNLRELKTTWISKSRLQKLWDVTNQPDTDDEEDNDGDYSYANIEFDFNKNKNFHPPPGGSGGSLSSSRLVL